jgi:hypothetical protein
MQNAKWEKQKVKGKRKDSGLRAEGWDCEAESEA